MPMVSHYQKSHVVPHFNCLDLTNSMVPFMMPSALCVAANANSVTWSKKSHCTSFWSPWPKECRDATEDAVSIIWHWCWYQWSHITKKVIFHIISILVTKGIQCHNLQHCLHHVNLMPIASHSCCTSTWLSLLLSLYDTYVVLSLLLYLLCTALYKVLAQAFLLYCITPAWGGALPNQINSLRSIQVCKPHTQQSEPWTTCLHSHTSLISHINPTSQAGRSMVVEHVPIAYTCSFLCTCHIGMTVNIPAFYEFQITLGTCYMLILI